MVDLGMNFDEFFDQFSDSLATEMKILDKADPNWRKIFMQKVLNRWKEWLKVSDVEMDLTEMKIKALEKNSLVWPVARIMLHHDCDGQNARIDKKFTSQPFFDRDECLKLFQFILSEPELSYIINREEGKNRSTDWFDDEFSWEYTTGEEVVMSCLMVNLTSFCFEGFFRQNRNKGISTFQLYMVTQFRQHSDKNCTNLNPYFGISAVYKEPSNMNWEAPDGFDNSELSKSRIIETIREHFEKLIDRPKIGLMTFNLD